ncbi:helix-turn-helix transcriptional regulator [Sphingobacterium hotanense]|uniref:WYL domain-containing protein n=1 Tax=Sphingobacterium hotanense TaxID=649196 RepID=A0ABT7NMJ5_9SPHI|nr:WYL domain-containing protein [Sphingobacterium hotanense]MDM1048462.1 WYL domain-containing protein [Sphingobacterium hotanense]
MAVNKNAQIRYKVLDKCFSNPYKKFYIDDLINHCSIALTDHYGKETTVSRRQIFIDIDFMRSDAGFEAPIMPIKDGRKVFYKYADSSFSILKKPLTNDELESIDNTLEIISRIKGIPSLSNLESLETKLLGAKDSNKNRIISFEENEFLAGIENLTLIFNFIKSEQVIFISYKSFKSNEIYKYIISPYYLKQYNNRWFLFGWNHDFQNIQNLALDRITSLEIVNQNFIDIDIDFEEYFEDIIGVTNFEENQVTDVSIELSENIIPYIVSKPIHGSQKVKDNILTIQVKLNYELESLILSYGENMKVLKPIDLKSRLIERLKITINQYS